MRVIEQNKYAELKVTKLISGNLCIEQYDFDNDSSEINIDKQGAEQLIEVLKEFVEDKRKSYGLTREKAERISITTEEAYISTYLSEHNNISVGDSIDILEHKND